MVDTKKVHSYFRITTKAFNRKRRENKSSLWKSYKDLFAAINGNSLDPISYFISEKYKLAYIVNSKAGCSSIKQAIMSSSGLDVEGDDYWKVHQEGKDKGFSRKQLSNIETDYFFFTFVRSPFSRLASLYLNKFCDQKTISQKGFEYKHYLGGVLDRNDSFERFITKIARIPDVLSDRHFKSQAYLINTEAVKIDFVGKFEEFNTDYDRLRKDYPLADLKVINKSMQYNLCDIYTKSTLKIVAKKYEEDIELYGYKNEYDRLKAQL